MGFPSYVFIGGVLLSSIYFVSYSRYLMKKQNENNKKIKYKATIENEYSFDSHKRIYKYEIDNAVYEEIEKCYKNDLFGYPIVKEKLDLMLKSHIEKCPIEEEYIIFLVSDYAAQFKINNASNNNYLILEHLD